MVLNVIKEFFSVFLQTTIDGIGQTLERDAKIRIEIADIYKSLIDLLKLETLEKNFGSVIMKDFYGGVGKVECNMERLQRKHCPIVVAGKDLSKFKTISAQISLTNLILPILPMFACQLMIAFNFSEMFKYLNVGNNSNAIFF